MVGFIRDIRCLTAARPIRLMEPADVPLSRYNIKLVLDHYRLFVMRQDRTRDLNMAITNDPHCGYLGHKRAGGVLYAVQ